MLVLFGTEFQYSRKRRQDEEEKQSGEAVFSTVGAHFLSHKCAAAYRETETLDACIEDCIN